MAREALFALWTLDLELGAVVAAASDPMIAEIKLAWWREALERLDTAPPPTQPLLQALAAEVLTRGVSGAALSKLENRWLAALVEDNEPAFGWGARTLFQFAATALGRSDALTRGSPDFLLAGQLGNVWHLGVEARAIKPGSVTTGGWQAPRVNPVFRPLVGLAMIGNRDASRNTAGKPPEPRGSLMRQLILLRAVALGR